ncbi:hypothetical protein [Lederbergia lenta]|uniref:Uncharacterized protein n=1 Tax=Lederbergia lenta TaxID=1467 RepID=A0A2X4WBS8_LEDLE|nr:hypothetical protein [Lederbergia lenta]MEC2324192.1 hypothetical protein [Lederbergia lenta]SQI60503.1 Uncharacterised protein [Lederbergia lenta]
MLNYSDLACFFNRDAGIELPRDTPNHFPVLFTDDPMEILTAFGKKFTNKIILNNSGDMTNMILKNTDLLTEDVNIQNNIQNGREHI